MMDIRRLKRCLTYLIFQCTISFSSGHKFSAEKTVCEVCRTNQYDTPFYCAIKPDLPSCIFPICPKICEVIGEDNDPGSKLSVSTFVPYAPVHSGHFPLPLYLPRVLDDFISTVSDILSSNKTAGRSFEGQADSQTEPPPLEPEDFHMYNEETCEFDSPYLRQARVNSKYVEYRPANPAYSYKEISENAARYGLVMAEIRRPEDEHSLATSSVLSAVSSYGQNQPRVFYAYGFRDKTDLASTVSTHGTFLYQSDNSNVTFASIDPRQFGRTDEQCGVLSHVTGGDKRQYLVTRMWNCDQRGTAKRKLFGLFMYPPGSLCYRRSEEECSLKTQTDAGGERVFHNVIQLGQTLTRFIYLYSDQRTWDDAKAFCEAKGLSFLDLDPRWDDALRTYQVIEHFLRETKLNPVTMFWTSGKFEGSFLDGKFRWETTKTEFQTHYRSKPPPFSFSWWDDQKAIQDELKETPELIRRRNIVKPCVALALNPEDGAERPKINFKAWYCDFPSFFLCYKEINQTDNIMNGPTPNPTSGRRPQPNKDACDGIPPPPPPSNNTNNNATSEEPINPFNEATCSSTSTTATRLAPNSKFVDYRPKTKTFTIDQIDQKCKEFGLVPAEIKGIEDWNSITSSGIGGVLSGSTETTKYFYSIGMDDKSELGSLVYTESQKPITFSMFFPEGNTNINHRCVIVNSVPAPDGLSRGLMMHHEDCGEGKSENKIVYGLCMFPESWNCYKQSTEEISKQEDPDKETQLIPLGQTSNRSLFYNPVQRSWADAKRFCEASNLTLLDLDPMWPDTRDIMRIFREKIVRDGGLFQLTPLWTSGKLQGPYSSQTGQWETTQTSINFEPDIYTSWLRRQWGNLSSHREGSVQDACVEVSFDDNANVAKLRPDFCNIPKYFLCYRHTRGRGDPPGSCSLGIYIIDTGDLMERSMDTTDDDESDEDDEEVTKELVGPIPPGYDVLPNQFHSKEDDNDDHGILDEKGVDRGGGSITGHSNLENQFNSLEKQTKPDLDVDDIDDDGEQNVGGIPSKIVAAGANKVPTLVPSAEPTVKSFRGESIKTDENDNPKAGSQSVKKDPTPSPTPAPTTTTTPKPTPKPTPTPTPSPPTSSGNDKDNNKRLDKVYISLRRKRKLY